MREKLKQDKGPPDSEATERIGEPFPRKTNSPLANRSTVGSFLPFRPKRVCRAPQEGGRKTAAGCSGGTGVAQAALERLRCSLVGVGSLRDVCLNVVCSFQSWPLDSSHKGSAPHIGLW